MKALLHSHERATLLIKVANKLTNYSPEVYCGITCSRFWNTKSVLSVVSHSLVKDIQIFGVSAFAHACFQAAMKVAVKRNRHLHGVLLHSFARLNALVCGTFVQNAVDQKSEPVQWLAAKRPLGLKFAAST